MSGDVSSSWVIDVKLDPPSLRDNRADADRLIHSLESILKCPPLTVDLDLLKNLSVLLRDAEYRARCTVGKSMDGVGRLLDVRDPDSAPPLGLALDLGTSRISFLILDLVSSELVAEGHFDNPQSKIAADVLARAHQASREPGLDELQSLVVDGIKHAVAGTCKGAGLKSSDIVLAAIAGNTIMSHLLLGLSTRWLIREPYTPVTNAPGLYRCSDIGLSLSPGAGLFVFPNAGAYFGGDLISGILFSELHRNSSPAMLVDVGTNAEVVLGNSEWLVACAGAAGPALESGVASIGMLADEGVIDKVWLEQDKGKIAYRVIGGGKPKGICGSGLIDLAACLFNSGMMDMQGRLSASACGERFTKTDGLGKFVLVPGIESASGQDLSLDERELESLKKAKAAMFTILETISSSVGVGLDEVERFFVAGSFGSVIDPGSAISIGMLPDLPKERFVPLGNSSLQGAARLLIDASLVDEIRSIRDRVTYMELNVNQEFMTRFRAAQFFPHTDTGLFPSSAR